MFKFVVFVLTISAFCYGDIGLGLFGVFILLIMGDDKN